MVEEMETRVELRRTTQALKGILRFFEKKVKNGLMINKRMDV